MMHQVKKRALVGGSLSRLVNFDDSQSVDILSVVFSFMGNSDLGSVLLVSKQFHEVVKKRAVFQGAVVYDIKHFETLGKFSSYYFCNVKILGDLTQAPGPLSRQVHLRSLEVWNQNDLRFFSQRQNDKLLFPNLQFLMLVYSTPEEFHLWDLLGTYPRRISVEHRGVVYNREYVAKLCERGKFRELTLNDFDLSNPCGDLELRDLEPFGRINARSIKYRGDMQLSSSFNYVMSALRTNPHIEELTFEVGTFDFNKSEEFLLFLNTTLLCKEDEDNCFPNLKKITFGPLQAFYDMENLLEVDKILGQIMLGKTGIEEIRIDYDCRFVIDVEERLMEAKQMVDVVKFGEVMKNSWRVSVYGPAERKTVSIRRRRQ